MNFVDRPILVVVRHPVARRVFLPQADDEDVAVFIAARLEFAADGFEVERRQRMIEGHNLHQHLAAHAVEE